MNAIPLLILCKIILGITDFVFHDKNQELLPINKFELSNMG